MTESKTFFDTAIFIYALEEKDPNARSLIYERMKQGKVGTSVITLMEYAVGCIKHNKQEDLNKFNSFLKDFMFEIKNIDVEVSIEAAKIRAEYPSFKPMDSLQIASAKVAGADTFCTNDKQLLQYENESIKVIALK